jgi:uncharacterized protein (DUF302 family)
VRLSVTPKLAYGADGLALGVLFMATNGLVAIQSSLGPAETMDRLVSEVRAKGLTIFARVDHAAGAKEAGLPLRPTEVLIFGNARGGTPLMQVNQTIGIDLPIKVLVWQDAAGSTWISYNDPAWLANRHGLGPEVEPAVKAMTGLLSALVHAASTAA